MPNWLRTRVDVSLTNARVRPEVPDFRWLCQFGYVNEGEDVEGSIASTAKEDSNGDNEREDDFEHEAPF
jgi:hypothetical protein